MIAYILLAFFNGTVIGTSRAINGRLGAEIGSVKASLWNHLIGFLFLTPALLLLGGWKFEVIPEAPASAYIGGFFGALFVAVNSYVFPRLGAMNASLLVISGQMISAVLLDYRNQGVAPTVTRCLGVVIVLFGVYLTRAAKNPRVKDKSQ
ncbi:DMT family transporter [Archangium violaceum]|uniref:DMT family transporter n=1 Tax=Archangium violaceum TaxID=83451 RepID=UPI00193AFF0D|nr:DMT family transporter [Archangium violaceum]QRK04328.1 DMT family transporter [Archangium violaceum]